MSTRIPAYIIILVVAFVIMSTTSANAHKRSTTRKIAGCEAPVAQPDSITADTADIKFSGYDKPLRATKETVFITNNSPHRLIAVSFITQYVDTSGRQLHSISRKVAVDIPSGETRRIDFKSWDVQKSFYFVGSRRPRTSAIPYNIRIIPEYIYY